MKLFKSSNQIVKEIHSEIDSAQDRLLQEAKKILSVPENNKAQRLKAVGFVGADIVKDYEKKYGDASKAREMAELIEYYKQTYPFQKFITEDEMNRICKKYKLIHAPISRYKKDVPENNLVDIENMPSLKYNDVQAKRIIAKYDNSFCFGVPKEIKKQIRNGVDISGMSDYEYDLTLSPSDYVAKKFGYRRSNLTNYGSLGWTATIQNLDGFFIAAPKSHFNLSGLKKTSIFGFGFITEVKDPIVFRYVRGGIQIATKWGY